MAFIGFFIAILAQILNGTVSIFDKFLLQKTLRPTTFAFWISLTSLGAFVLLPFDFAIPTGEQWFINLAAGATFSLALVFMYEALQKEELTRVVPTLGTLIPIFTLLVANFFLGETLSQGQILAVFILIVGIIFLTYRHSPKPSNWLVLGSAALAAFGFALSSVLIKEAFLEQPFAAGLAWSRLGGLVIIPIVLANKENREEIFRKREIPKKGNIIIFGLGRIFSGAGFILVNLAYAILSPAVVNALQSVQYAFIFLATLFLRRFWPKLLNEKISRRLMAARITGIIAVIIGSIILGIYE